MIEISATEEQMRFLFKALLYNCLKYYMAGGTLIVILIARARTLEEKALSIN